MNVISLPRYPIAIEGETTNVGAANELAITLDVLQGQYDRAVLEQLRPHLAEIIAASGGLGLVLKSLARDDQLYLIEAVGPRLGELIPNAPVLRDLLAGMAHAEVELKLLEALGRDGLRALLVTAEELAEVLEWVYGQADRRLLDLLGLDAVRRMLHSGYELGLVLHCVDRDLQADLLNYLGWDSVANLVIDGRDLAYLLRALPQDNSLYLIQRFSPERLADLIGNVRDWEFLYNRLEDAEAELVCQLLGVERHAA